MRRSEVLHQFKVQNGEITTPGQWEGAPLYAPYYYAAYRAGRPADRCTKRNGDVLAVHYVVTHTDRIAFPELLDVIGVTLYVDVSHSLGFMCCDPERSRLGGRRPNVGDEEEDEGGAEKAGDEDDDEDDGTDDDEAPRARGARRGAARPGKR